MTLQLTFSGGVEGRRSWSVGATFHDADLRVDAILGLPWLRKCQLGVFPHLEALARWEDPRLLLQVGQKTTRQKSETYGKKSATG